MRYDSQVDLKNLYCPSCLGSDLDIFYTVENVPAHSVVLLRSKQDALNFPRGEISLGYCKQCGFVSNLAFNSGLQDYSHEYEATQAYSATFTRFNRRLAEKLIERYQLHGKRIIEIGCGQGEFLSMLCESGGNLGIGFDPAYEPQRQLGPLPDNVQVIPDYFSEKYADHFADFICCKMTLEHIHPTYEFIRMIRRSLGKQSKSVVFFQIPNARYVFGDLAFWDVYYEHCSYFSKGSVARLFQKAGYDVMDLWLDYQDQYLMVEAIPSLHTPGRIMVVNHNDLHDMGSEIEQFARIVPQKKEQWARCLVQYQIKNQKVVLWGGGSKAVAFLTSLNLSTDLIEYAVDINPNKTGTFLPGYGQEVIAPVKLLEIQPDVILIMNPIYREEIQAYLESINIHPSIITIEDI